MDTITIIQESQPTKKVDISLRQLIDIDETGGITAQVGTAEGKITNNQVLTAYAEKIDPTGTLGKVKTFRFKNLASIITGGTGVTVTTDKDGITSITNTGVTKIIAGTNISVSPITGVGDVTITNTASSSLAINTTPITGGTVGRVLFQGAGNVLQQSGNLFWDNTNIRLGVGVTPTRTLHVQHIGTTGVTGSLLFYNQDNSYSGLSVLSNGVGFSLNAHTNGTGYISATSSLNFTSYNGTNPAVLWMGNGSRFRFTNTAETSTYLLIANSGNVLVNTTTDAGFKFDVNGTGRIVTSLIIGDTGNPSGSLIVGRTISIGYVATVGANQSFRLGGSGATINTNSFLMSSGGYNNQLGAIGICRYVVGAAPTSVGANSVTNLYVLGTEAIKLNDGTSSGINSFYNAGIVTIDLSVMEASTTGNSNVYAGQFVFRFKRYLINGVGTFTDISAVTNLYNSADATLIGTTLQAVANGADALDIRVTLPATANTAAYRMGANVTITKVNINS